MGYGYKIGINLTNNNYEYYVSYYNENGSFDGSGYLGYSKYFSGTSFIPAYAIKFAVTFRRKDLTALSDADITAISSSLSAYAPTDTTLERAGVAADAKACGELITTVSTDLNNYKEFLSSVLSEVDTYDGFWVVGQYINSAGGIEDNYPVGAYYNRYIDAFPFVFSNQSQDSSGRKLYVFIHEYDSDENWIRRIKISDPTIIYQPSSDCAKIRFAFQSGLNGTDSFHMTLEYIHTYFHLYYYNQDFRGRCGSSFASCVKSGWYNFWNSDIASITDKPSNLTSNGILYVHCREDYPNVIYQTLIPSNSSDVWNRCIVEGDSSSLTWTSMLGDLDYHYYRGAITTQDDLYELTLNGWYIAFQNSLNHNKDIPEDLNSGYIMLVFNTTNSEWFARQVIIPFDASSVYIRSVNTQDPSSNSWNSLAANYVTTSKVKESSNIVLDLQGKYHNNSTVESFPSSLSDFYSLYDNFLSNTDVTRNILGYATNVDGTPNENLPIYEYVISNPIKVSTGSVPIIHSPKILLTSGIHSDEKTSMMELYNFVASLFDSTNENAQALRYGLSFKIVPCINPWGYDAPVHPDYHEGRFNARGVNLNRNFGFNWSSSTATDKGTSPYSELETQALKSWLDANTDALFHLDCHNSAYTTPYLPSSCIHHRKTWMGSVRRMMNYLQTTYGWNFLGGTECFLEHNNIPGVSAEAYNICKIDSSIVEQPYGNSYINISTQWIKRETEMLGNFIMDLLRSYRI